MNFGYIYAPSFRDLILSKFKDKYYPTEDFTPVALRSLLVKASYILYYDYKKGELNNL